MDFHSPKMHFFQERGRNSGEEKEESQRVKKDRDFLTENCTFRGAKMQVDEGRKRRRKRV